jgi:predicted alpha/beta-fold hydrolase
MDNLLDNTTTLQEFDDKITKPLWGYQTIQEYYDESSGKHWVPEIRIPFLVIQALDDPICPQTVIPWKSIRSNPNVILVTTKHGGHIAWLEGWTPTGNNWADRVSMEFVHSVLDHIQAANLVNV